MKSDPEKLKKIPPLFLGVMAAKFYGLIGERGVGVGGGLSVYREHCSKTSKSSSSRSCLRSIKRQLMKRKMQRKRGEGIKGDVMSLIYIALLVKRQRRRGLREYTNLCQGPKKAIFCLHVF